MKRGLWLPLALLLAGACDDRPRAVITLSPIPEDAQTLYVSLNYRGMPATRPAPIRFDLSTEDRSQPASFGIYLPAMTDGDLSVGAGIINSEDCLSATGRGQTTLVSQGSSIDVPLEVIPSELYTRAERCTKPSITPLLLSATPNLVSSAGKERVTLLGWWGVARDTCPLVNVNGESATVISCASVVELIATVPPSPGMLGPVPVEVRPQNAAITSTSSAVLSYYAAKIAFVDGKKIYPVGAAPTALAVGLIDDDARPDLLVANRDGGTISVLRSGGTNELQSALTMPLPAGARPSAVGLVQLNSDDRADLVMVSATEGALRTYLQTGSPAAPTWMMPPERSFVNLLPGALAVGDIDKDGALDLAVANQISSDVSLFYNRRDGHVTRFRDVSVEREPTAVRLVDLNRDGYADLVTLHPTKLKVSVVINGNGGFASAGHLAVPFVEPPVAMALEDLDGNLSPDLIVGLTNGTIVVRWNDGAGRFSSGTDSPLTPTSSVVALAGGDFDLDGRPDIAMASTQGVAILRNTLTRTQKRGLEVATTLNLDVNNKATALAVGFFDGDLLPDLAVATQVSGQPNGFVQILTNQSQ